LFKKTKYPKYIQSENEILKGILIGKSINF